MTFLVQRLGLHDTSFIHSHTTGKRLEFTTQRAAQNKANSLAAEAKKRSIRPPNYVVVDKSNVI